MAVVLFIGVVAILVAAITMLARRSDATGDALTIDSVTAQGLGLGPDVVPWDAVQRVAIVTKQGGLRRQTRFGFQVDVDRSHPGLASLKAVPLLLVSGDEPTAALLAESFHLSGFDHDVVLDVLRRAEPGPTMCFVR